MTDFVAIEQGLTELLDNLRQDFHPEDTAIVNEYIEHAEYGLALETIVDILQDEEIIAGKPALEKILSIAGLMEIEDGIRERLTGLLPN